MRSAAAIVVDSLDVNDLSFPKRAARDYRLALAATLSAYRDLRALSPSACPLQVAEVANRIESASGLLKMHALRVAETRGLPLPPP